MSSVSLKNVKKIYPHVDSSKKRRAKKDDSYSDSKPNLQITEEGVVAVQEFNLIFSKTVLTCKISTIKIGIDFIASNPLKLFNVVLQ